jgi:hypothetical protein
MIYHYNKGTMATTYDSQLGTDSTPPKISRENDMKSMIYCRGKYYPKNVLFILGNANTRILAKITQKRLERDGYQSPMKLKSPAKPDKMNGQYVQFEDVNFSKLSGDIPKRNGKQYVDSGSDNSRSPSPDKSAHSRKEIFSLCDKGIKSDNWAEVTPELIAEHVAGRLRCCIILDALCGVGGNTIQFAKKCNFVIAIDIEPVKTDYARHNAELYNVTDKIDFFAADFLKVKNLNADVVFIAPSDVNPENEDFSIFKHLVPNMVDVTGKALEISYCLAFQLPKTIDVEELPALFNESFNKHETYSKRFCIEIEEIYVNDELECYMVYFGNSSSIQEEEEYEKMYQFICDNELPDWSNKYPIATVRNIIQRVGLHKSLKYLFNLSVLLCNQEKFNESLFDTFLVLITTENIMTNEEIQRLNTQEIFRRQLNVQTLAPSQKPFFSENKEKSESKINGTAEKMEPSSPDKYYKKTQHDLDQRAQLNGIGKMTTNSSDKLSNANNKGDHPITSPQSDLSKSNRNSEMFKKNSLDAYSDLALSSYSVASGLFRDSYSEDLLSPTSPNGQLFHEFNSGDKVNEEYQMKFDDKPKQVKPKKGKKKKEGSESLKSKRKHSENDNKTSELTKELSAESVGGYSTNPFSKSVTVESKMAECLNNNIKEDGNNDYSEKIRKV